MRYTKISSPEPAIHYIVKTLASHLEARERVLWFVTGGSSIALEAQMSRQLVGAPVANLTVTLTDERPGPVGHPDSNWRLLREAGFALLGATLRPVLSGDGSDVEAAAMDRFVSSQLAAADFAFAIFSAGADGHIAGIPATNSQTPAGALYARYEVGDYKRISVTPAVFPRLDEAVLFITGDAKRPQFERFQTELPVSEQAAQAAKTVPSLTVFNSFKGES